MIRTVLFISYVLILTACNKPYGQDEVVTENFPDSLIYPEINEIQDSDDPFQYYRLAAIQYAQGNNSEAINNATEAIALDDENPLYYFLLAQLFASEGKHHQALDNALKAYSLGYINPDLQVLIAKLYYEVGEDSEGEHFLDVALKKRAGDPEIAFLRAELYLKRNDTVSALDWLAKTISLDSTFVPAYTQRAEIYIAQDSLPAAIDQLESVYREEPRDLENTYRIATMYMEAENYLKADTWFRKILLADSTYISAYQQLAQINMHERQYDSVRYYAERALKINTNFNDARLLIARSLDDQYRYSDALEVYREIVSRDSTFDIAITEMEVLEKKIAYLRRRRQEQDSARNATPAPVDILENSEN